MKGSAITGPVGKEAAELWPVREFLSSISKPSANNFPAYCQQLWCRHVKGRFFRGSGMEMVLLLHGSYGDSDDNKITHFSRHIGCGCDYRQFPYRIETGEFGIKVQVVAASRCWQVPDGRNLNLRTGLLCCSSRLLHWSLLKNKANVREIL
jgi:hypothetical protein